MTASPAETKMIKMTKMIAEEDLARLVGGGESGVESDEDSD